MVAECLALIEAEILFWLGEIPRGARDDRQAKKDCSKSRKQLPSEQQK